MTALLDAPGWLAGDDVLEWPRPPSNLDACRTFTLLQPQAIANLDFQRDLSKRLANQRAHSTSNRHTQIS